MLGLGTVNCNTMRISFMSILRRIRGLTRLRFCRIIIVLWMMFFISFILVYNRKCVTDQCNRHGLRRPHSFIKYFPNQKIRNISSKRILAWTGFFGDMSWEGIHDGHFQTCKIKKCTFTSDRKWLNDSDAVLFHISDWVKLQPLDLPNYRHPFQRWILYNLEPPPNIHLAYKHLAGVFNWTAWYRLDSDIPVSYGGLKEYDHLQKTRNTNISTSFGRKNKRTAAWIASNCCDYRRRQLFIREVKQFLGSEMDLYGACGSKMCPRNTKTCGDLISSYKFFFAIESTECKDYITEKFWDALRRRQVPIVKGAVGYESIAPPNSYINADSFKTVKDLTNYLMYLSHHPGDYNKYLKWTERYDIYGQFEGRRQSFCNLCEALHDNKRSSQVYNDLNGWERSELADCPQRTLWNYLSRCWDMYRIQYGLL